MLEKTQNIQLIELSQTLKFVNLFHPKPTAQKDQKGKKVAILAFIT